MANMIPQTVPTQQMMPLVPGQATVQTEKSGNSDFLQLLNTLKGQMTDTPQKQNSEEKDSDMAAALISMVYPPGITPMIQSLTSEPVTKTTLTTQAVELVSAPQDDPVLSQQMVPISTNPTGTRTHNMNGFEQAITQTVANLSEVPSKDSNGMEAGSQKATYVLESDTVEPKQMADLTKTTNLAVKILTVNSAESERETVIPRPIATGVPESTTDLAALTDVAEKNPVLTDDAGTVKSPELTDTCSRTTEKIQTVYEKLTGKLANHPVLNGTASASEKAVDNVHKHKVEFFASIESGSPISVGHLPAEQSASWKNILTAVTNPVQTEGALPTTATESATGQTSSPEAPELTVPPILTSTAQTSSDSTKSDFMNLQTPETELLVKSVNRTQEKNLTLDRPTSKPLQEKESTQYPGFTENAVTLQPTYHPVTASENPTREISREIPVYHQVAQGLTTALETGKSSLVLELKPEGLGKVTVKLVADDQGGLTLSLSSDNQQTVKLLQNQMGELKSSLESQNLIIHKVSASFESSQSTLQLNTSADLWSGQNGSQQTYANAGHQFSSGNGRQNSYQTGISYSSHQYVQADTPVMTYDRSLIHYIV